MTTKVLPGNRIEITALELREGESVDVFLVLPEMPASLRRSVLDIIASLPPNIGMFKTAEEADQYIRQERDSWDR